MTRFFILFIVILSFLFTEINLTPDTLPAIAMQDMIIRQWASDASATSEYSYLDWSAMQVTGKPDTPECGDFVTAWASANITDLAILTLTYDQAVIPSQVNIYQSLHPGSIVKVEIGNSVTGDIIEIPNSADPIGNTKCMEIFTLDITHVTDPIDTVVIYVDQNNQGVWNEIDAVEIVGVVLAKNNGISSNATLADDLSVTIAEIVSEFFITIWVFVSNIMNTLVLGK